MRYRPAPVNAIALLRACVVAAASAIAALPCAAQKSACDPGVRPVQEHPLGYRQRGERCEGIYWQPHAADSAIVVLSVAPAPLRTSGPVPAEFDLRWPANIPGATSAEVQLQATSLRRGLFYRMDALGIIAAGRFRWATDVVSGLGLGADEFAVQARTTVRLGGIHWPVHLPVWVNAPVSPTGQWMVRLVSNSALYGLAWECLRLDASGMPGVTVARGRLDGPFRADEALWMPVALPGFSGYCYLEVTGEPLAAQRGGKPAALAVFLAPGRP